MKRSILIFAAAVLLSACAGAKMTYLRLDSALAMKEHEGRKIELEGRISNTPWQHLIGDFDGFSHSLYFDVADFQIVIYSKERIACGGRLVARGTVVKVQGSSKRPGAKADESYVEYHLTVDGWECR